MRVIAIKEGSYCGRRIRKGVEFDAKDGQKSKWFVPVEEYKPVVVESDPEPSTFTEMNRAKGARGPVGKKKYPEVRPSDQEVI